DPGRGAGDIRIRRSRPMIRRLPVVLVLVSIVGACGSPAAPPYVDRVAIVPESAHVAVGETAQFRLVVLDQRGDSIQDRVERVQVSNTNGQALTLERSGPEVLVAALATGTSTIRADLGFGTGSAMVFMPPARVEEIILTPSPVVAPSGVSTRVTLQLQGAGGVILDPAGHRISWASTGEALFLTPRPPDAVTLTTTWGAGAMGPKTLIVVVDGKRLSVPIVEGE
ncbi:MAG: hypothetical protein RLN75_02965, partial [Longimicrobiales bacterium]